MKTKLSVAKVEALMARKQLSRFEYVLLLERARRVEANRKGAL